MPSVVVVTTDRTEVTHGLPGPDRGSLGGSLRIASDEKPDPVQRQRVTAVGDPLPLGLVAFAISTFAIGAILAGWWADPGAQLALALPLATAFGGVTQFVAGMWSFVRGQTLAATFFGTFGAFWGGIGLYQLVAVRANVGTAVGGGIATTALGPFGVVLACLCFIALVVAIASVSWNAGLSATSFAVAVALFCLAWASFAQGNTVLEAIAGWAGMVSAVAAFVTAGTLCISDRAGRHLPLTAPWKRPTWTRDDDAENAPLPRGGYRHRGFRR